MRANSKLHQYTMSDAIHHPKLLRADYENNGILYLSDFVDSLVLHALSIELNQAQDRAEEDIKNNWNNEKIVFYSKNAGRSNSFVSDYVTQKYFLESYNKAHVFYEMNQERCYVNRIGHGMHLLKEFHRLQNIIYRNSFLNRVLKNAGFIKPVCHLSVYIPKHAHEAGSLVRPHQESTFAYTEPQSAVVLWIALEDARIENACMWGIPGSNHWPLQFVSRVDHQLKLRRFERVNFEKDIPDFELQKEAFIPLEVSAGDALFFHGNFVHCSPVNSSALSRKALSMQFIETHHVDYPESNWLQPRNDKFIFDLSETYGEELNEYYV